MWIYFCILFVGIIARYFSFLWRFQQIYTAPCSWKAEKSNRTKQNSIKILFNRIEFCEKKCQWKIVIASLRPKSEWLGLCQVIKLKPRAIQNDGNRNEKYALYVDVGICYRIVLLLYINFYYYYYYYCYYMYVQYCITCIDERYMYDKRMYGRSYTIFAALALCLCPSLTLRPSVFRTFSPYSSYL